MVQMFGRNLTNCLPKDKVARIRPSYANANEGAIDNFLMICSINFAITSVVMAVKPHFFC